MKNYQAREVLISINRESQNIGMLVDVQGSVWHSGSPFTAGEKQMAFCCLCQDDAS